MLDTARIVFDALSIGKRVGWLAYLTLIICSVKSAHCHKRAFDTGAIDGKLVADGAGNAVDSFTIALCTIIRTGERSYQKKRKDDYLHLLLYFISNLFSSLFDHHPTIGIRT